MNRKFCCTDLHGQWNLWDQIRKYCDSTDTIYFLGDAIDRGPDGLKIMKDMLSDKRVIYLKGNHEDLMIESADFIMGKCNDTSMLYTWRCNGNYHTEDEFSQMPIEFQRSLIAKLKKLPIKQVIINSNNQEILLSHAGTAPDYTSADFLIDGGKDTYIWNRRHITRRWANGFDNFYIVHGHTPVQYVKKNLIPNMTDSWEEDGEDGILTYANEHKFDLDLGSFATHKAALFNLDTLKVTEYFYDTTAVN